MSRIFLSHSSSDERESVALKEWLAQNGWEDVFLDIDSQRGLTAGERWQDALRRASDLCEAVIFIVSPAWAQSKWCLAEFLLAKSLHKQIFGVVLKPVPVDELPRELTYEWQICSLVGDGSRQAIHFQYKERDDEIGFLSEGLQRLKIGLQKAGLGADFFRWPPDKDPERSPYRGLEPLDVPDAAVYFGRDLETQRGLDVLRGMRAGSDKRLFVILGPSGSGKSSFLRAGLLPRLKRDDRHFYPLPVVRPLRHPISGDTGLAYSLARARSDLGLRSHSIGSILDSLNSRPTAFSENLTELRDAAFARFPLGACNSLPPTLVLSIDQTEELFNSDAGEEAHQLLRHVGNEIRYSSDVDSSNQVPLIVLFTVRSDRYEPLQVTKELEGVQSFVFDDLKPISPDHFREIIVGPANRVTQTGRKLEIKSDLVEKLISECREGGDTLPLLGLTLARLYRDYGQGSDLGLDEYSAMGGLPRIVKNEVEAVLSNNSSERVLQLKILRSALIPSLVTVAPESGLPMRRIAEFSNLPIESHSLIDALCERRIFSTYLRNGQKVVEIAHEALVRQWDVLCGWMLEEREALQRAEMLERAAIAWKDHLKDEMCVKIAHDDWLFSGARLLDAEDLVRTAGYDKRLSWCCEFLMASRKQEDRKNAREARLQRRLRFALAASLTLLVFVSIGSYYLKLAEERAKKNFQEATILRIANDDSRLQMAYAAEGGSMISILALVAAYRLADASFPAASSVILGRIGEEYQRNIRLIRTDTYPYPLTSVAFSPDGRSIALAGLEGGAPQLQGIEKNSHDILPGRRDEGAITSIAYSPDGRYVVSGNEYGALFLRNARTGVMMAKPFEGHTGVVFSVAFSPDGRRIVSGGDDHTLRIWNAETGKVIGEPLKGHMESVTSVAFSPDGRRIASGSNDKTLRLWDSATGESIGKPLLGHAGSVTAIAYSPNGQRLASGSFDGTVRQWDAKTGVAIGLPLNGHADIVSSIAFSPDGRRIVSGGEDQTLRFWDVATGLPSDSPLKGHTGTVKGVAFSPDGRYIVSVGFDGVLCLWSASSSAEQLYAGDVGAINDIGFSSDGKKVAFGGEDGVVRMFDFNTKMPIGDPFKGHSLGVTSIAFSPNGRLLVSASKDKTLRLWDAVEVGSSSSTLTGHTGPVTDVAFSSDGRLIASGSEDKTVRLWSTTTRAPVGAPLIGHTDKIKSISFSPDGRLLISASADKTLRLWDVTNGKAIGNPFRGHEDPVTAVAFSPDGKIVVSGSEDQTLRIWDVKKGAQIGEPLGGHTSFVTSVAISPDGRYIVSGGDEKTVRLWTLSTGTHIGDALKAHGASVTSVAFSPDGLSVASASTDGTLRVWPVLNAWIEALCAKPSRNMTAEEWRKRVSPDIRYVVQCPNLSVP